MAHQGGCRPVIDDAGQADLIGPSVSCGQTIGRSNRHTHCGACSQCLDRRFGVLAAGLAGHDPASQYEIDLVTGERTRDADRAMLVGYLDRARRVAGMDPAGFFAAYGEAARVLPRGLGRAGEVASRVYDLYRRHADEVLGVVAGVIRGDADRLARGAGGPSPLVALSIEPPRPAAEVPVGEPDYLFRKGGDFWAVRFAGSETKYVNDSEGMRLIATLLGRPHAEVGALELLGVTPRPPGTPAPQAGLTLTDGASLADYRRAVKAVEGQIEQAREARDFEDLEGLELQRDTLLRHIRSVTTIEGKLRAASSDPERARKLVVNNVGNAVKALRKHLPALADHHRLTLKRGAVSRYAPATPVPWEF